MLGAVVIVVPCAVDAQGSARLLSTPLLDVLGGLHHLIHRVVVIQGKLMHHTRTVLHYPHLGTQVEQTVHTYTRHRTYTHTEVTYTHKSFTHRELMCTGFMQYTHDFYTQTQEILTYTYTGHTVHSHRMYTQDYIYITYT